MHEITTKITPRFVYYNLFNGKKKTHVSTRTSVGLQRGQFFLDSPHVRRQVRNRLVANQYPPLTNDVATAASLKIPFEIL